MQYPRGIRSAVRGMERAFKNQGRRMQPFALKKGDSKLLVLKTEGEEERFTVLATIENYQAGDFDKFRNASTFNVATLAENYGENENQNLGEVLAIADYIVLIPQNEFYALGEADETRYIFLNFIYRIFGTKNNNKLTDAEMFNFYPTPPPTPVFSLSQTNDGNVKAEWTVTNSQGINNYILTIQLGE